ncbi:hypothetical protein GW17_00054379 [Ensete ventricosum]|nr:hypothetical protein GW17_00054379 [Ensete ventricosum]
MRSTDLGGVTNLITQLVDNPAWRHRSRTPRLLVVVGATLRYWSRMPGLAMKDAATSQHRSRMPRWLGEKIWCWSSTRSGLNRFGTEETTESSVKNRGKHQRVRSFAALVWASTSDGRGRWTSVRDSSMNEKQQIWFGIAHLDAQAAVEAGLSWPRLSSGRIRRCGCRHRRSTLIRPLAIESPVGFL